MSKDPLISFVVPVYKTKPEVLENCLKSLRDMSYKRIEIVVVFDGEPEDEELVKIARKHTPLDNIIAIEHRGAPAARNAGYKKTHGVYVSFWDSDCYAKPEMARRWVQEFKDSGADFVYSGYEFSGHQQGINGEPFDPYLLTCNNYIATMFPMKREIFPGFDESLKGGQDWDLWLSIVEKGYKGSYIEGYGFITEPPSLESISGKAWNADKFKETHLKVRRKHNIPQRDFVVGSSMQKLKALHIAKLIKADFSQFLDFRINDYKLALNLGFGEQIFFINAPQECTKVQYWLPWDITGLENYPFSKSVSMLKRIVETGSHHWVNEIVSQKRLARLFEFVGMEAPKIVPLPSEVDETEKTLPAKFRVLLDIDEAYLPVFKTIKQDLPYLHIDELDYKTNPIVRVEDYSLLVSFKQHPTIDEAIRRMLINGRNVISNVQAPHCGYLDLEISMKEFKQTLIREIRDAQVLKFNEEASKHYKEEIDPKRFLENIEALIPRNTVLEVV